MSDDNQRHTCTKGKIWEVTTSSVWLIPVKFMKPKCKSTTQGKQRKRKKGSEEI